MTKEQLMAAENVARLSDIDCILDGVVVLDDEGSELKVTLRDAVSVLLEHETEKIINLKMRFSEEWAAEGKHPYG